MKSRTAITLLLALLLSTIGLWYFVEAPLPHAIQPALSTSRVIGTQLSGSAGNANPGRALESAYTGVVNGVRQNPTENSVISAYRTARDYRTFFEMAILRPKEGGYYLAGIAALDCSTLVAPGEKTQAQAYARQLNSIASDAPNRAQRIDAIKTRHERCLPFDLSPQLYGASASIWRDGGAKEDPVLSMKADGIALYKSDGSLQRLPILLEKAVASNNPYVLEAALMQLGAGAFLFPTFINNERVPIEHALAFGQAMSLVPCQFGMDCGPNSRSALDLCIANNCGLNWYDVMQQSTSPREFTQTMAYHDAIVAALRSGNYGAINVQSTPILTGLPKGK